MGSQAIFHGRITLRSSAHDALEIIGRFSKSVSYPWITEEAFSKPPSRKYDEEVLGFALTRKYSEWQDFLIQFECLLAQLDFDVAKTELETEMEGTFHWYWRRKPYRFAVTDIEQLELYETPRWFFGQGVRSMWGFRLDGYDTFPVPWDFYYPFVFRKDALIAYERALPRLSKVPVGERIAGDRLPEICGDKAGIHPDILNYLSSSGKIRCGYEQESGPWIERLETLAPLLPILTDNFG